MVEAKVHKNDQEQRRKSLNMFNSLSSMLKRGKNKKNMSQVTGEPYDSDGNTTDLSFAENDARASDAKHKSNSNGMTPVDTERELDRLQSDNKVPDVNFGSKVLETTSSSHRGQYTPLESKKNPAAVTTHTHFPSYADVNNDLSMSGFDEVTLSENSLLGVVDVVPGDPLSGFELGTSPQPYHLRKSINVDDGSEQRMNGGPETSHKLARANMDTDETDTEVSRNDIDHTGVEPFKVGPIYSDNDSSQVAERADGIVPDRLDVSDIASDHGMGLDTVGVSESESDEDAIESKDIIHNGTNSGTEGAGFNRVGVSDSESDSEAIRVNRVVAENQSDNVDEKVAGFNKAAHSSAERESDEQMIGFNRVAHSDVDNDADGEMTGFNRVAVQSESEDESTGAGFNRVGHSDSDSTDTEELSGFNRVATASDSDTDREGAGFERVAHSDSESADDGQQFGFNRVAFASDSEGGSVVAGYDRGTHSDAESDEEKAGFNRVAPESESESEGEVAGFNRAVHSDADSDSDPPAGFNRVAAMGDSESEAETSGFNRVAHSDTESGDDSAGFRRVGVSDSESDAESEGDANGFNRVGHSDTESDSDPPAGFNRVAAMSESESEAEMSGFNRVAHSDTGSDDDNDAGFRRVGVSDSESDTENNVHATGASSIARGDAGNGGKLPVGGRSFGVESVACGDTEGQTGCNLDGRSDTSNDTEPIETQRVIKIPLDTAATQDNLEKKSPRPPSRRFSRESMSVSVEDVLSYYTGSGSGSGSDRNEEDGVAIGALGEPVSNEGIPTSAKSLAGAAAVAGIAVLGGAAVLPCAAVGACDVTALSGAQDPEVEVARGVEEVDEMGDKPFQQSRDKGADSVPSIKPRTGAGVVEGDDRPVGKSRRVLPDAGRTKTASESSTDADVSSATGRKPKPRQRTPNRTGPTGTLSATTSNTDTDTTETNRTANGQPRQTTRPVPTQASASQLPHVPRPRHSVDTKYRADGLSSGANSMSSLASNTSVSSILRTGDSTCGVGTPLDDDQKKKVAFRSMSTGNDMTATIAALHPNKAGRPRGPSDGSVPVSVPMRRNSSQNTADDTAAASASVPQPTKATRPDISRGPAAMPGGVPVPVMRAHRSVDSGHSITLDESAPAVLPPKPTVAKRQSSQGSLPVAAMHSSNDDIATTPAKVVPKKITRPSVTESSAANTASNGDTADESVADAYPPRAKKSIGLSDGAVDPVEKPVIQDRVKKPVKTPVKEPLSYRSTEPAKQHQVAVTEAIKEPAPNATQESSNLFNPPTAARDASTGVLSTPQPPVVAQTGEHTAVTSSSQEHVPSPIARPDTHASRVTQRMCAMRSSNSLPSVVPRPQNDGPDDSTAVHRRGSRPETSTDVPSTSQSPAVAHTSDHTAVTPSSQEHVPSPIARPDRHASRVNQRMGATRSSNSLPSVVPRPQNDGPDDSTAVHRRGSRPETSTDVPSTSQSPAVAHTSEHTAVTPSSQEHVPSPIARPDTYASRVNQRMGATRSSNSLPSVVPRPQNDGPDDSTAVHRRGSRPETSTDVPSTSQSPAVAHTSEHTAVTPSSQEHVPSPIARPDTHASRVNQRMGATRSSNSLPSVVPRPQNDGHDDSIAVHRRGSRPETISRSEEASSREVMEDSIGKGLPSKVPRPMRASTSAGTSSLRNVEAHIEAPEKTPCPTVSDSPVGRGSGMADGVGKDTSGAVVTKPTVARRQDKKDPTAQKFTKRRQRKGQNVNRKKSVLVDDDVGFDLTKEIAYQNDADDGGTYRTRTTNPFDSPAMHQNPDLIPEASCDILYRPPNTDINTDTNTNTHTNTNTNSSTNQSNAQKPKPKVRSNPFEESPAVGMDHGLIQDKHGYSDSTAGATTVLQAMRAAPGNYQRLEDSRPSHPTNNNNYNSNYNDNYNNNNFNGPLSSNSMNSMNSINSMNTMTSQPARPNNGSGLASGYIAGGATGVRNLPNVEIPSGYGNVGGKGYNTVMSPGSVGDRRSRDQFNADPSPRGQNVYESPRGVARNITPRDAYGAPSSQSPLNDYGRAMGRQQSYGNVEATANAKPQRAMGRQQSYGNVEATASAKPHPVPRNKAEYNSDLNDNLSAGGVAGSVFSPSPLSSEEDILDYQSVANGKKHSATLKRVLSHHSSGGLARQASQLGVGYDTVRQGTTTALSSGNSGPMSGPMSGRKVMSRSQDQLNVPGSRTPRGMEREQTHMVRSGSQGRLEHRHAPAVRRGSRGNAEATAPQYMMRSTDSLAKDTDVRKSFHSFYDRPGSSHFAPHETQDIRSPAQSRQRKQNPQRKNTDYANGDPYGVQSYLTQSMNNNNNNQRNASNTQYGEDIGNQYNTQNGRVQGQGQHRHPQQNQYQNPSGQPMRGQTAAPMQRSMDLDTATFNSGKKGKKASRRSLKSRSMYSVKSMDDVGGDYRSEKDKKCVIS